MTPFDPANPDFDLPQDPLDRERWRRLVGQPRPIDVGLSDSSGPNCISALELAAFIDGRVDDAAELDAIESHLASCPACLNAMVEARHLLASPSDSFAFVSPEVLSSAKSFVSPAEYDIQITRHVRVSRWMGVVRWAGAAAASFGIGILGWQAGQATNVTGDSVAVSTAASTTSTAGADDRQLVSELSLGALDDTDDEFGFTLLSLLLDEGSAS